MYRIIISLIPIFTIFLPTFINAEVILPQWFGDYMVLQSNSEYGARSFINGKATANESVRVSVSLGSKILNTYETIASPQGDWIIQVLVSNTIGNNTYTINVTGSNTTTPKIARDVLGGDVFLCSGQSNMVFPMQLTINASEEIATLKYYPNFRFFKTNIGTSEKPQFLLPENCTDPKNECSECNKWYTSSEAMSTNYIQDFSAVCYMTVRDVARLHSTIGESKAVGLVQSAVGGTRIEAWMSSKAIQKATKSAGLAPPEPSSNSYNKPSALYNAMIAPFNKMSIRSALWYQGEANAETSYSVSKIDFYASYLTSMIESWRDLKGIGDFGFFVVALPPSMPAEEPEASQLASGRPEVRIAEIEVATPRPGSIVDNSGVAICTELGGSSAWGIDHPYNKVEISKRLALQVVHGAYGIQGRMNATENGEELYTSLWTGPVLRSVKVYETNVTIHFQDFSSTKLNLHDVKGVNSDGSRDDCTLCCEKQAPFEVSSDGTNWTRLSVNDVVLGSSSVTLRETKNVKSVRYGWMDAPECVLMNQDSLPLAPFRYDDDNDDGEGSEMTKKLDRQQYEEEKHSTSSLRPPMGFNTWNYYHCNIDENSIMKIADSLVDTGLARLGYEYINLDDCWMVNPRNEDGTIQVDPVKFPSGIKHLADYVHSKGLKLGLYVCLSLFSFNPFCSPNVNRNHSFHFRRRLLHTGTQHKLSRHVKIVRVVSSMSFWTLRRCAIGASII